MEGVSCDFGVGRKGERRLTGWAEEGLRKLEVSESSIFILRGCRQKQRRVEGRVAEPSSLSNGTADMTRRGLYYVATVRSQPIAGMYVSGVPHRQGTTERIGVKEGDEGGRGLPASLSSSSFARPGHFSRSRCHLNAPLPPLALRRQLPPVLLLALTEPTTLPVLNEAR